MERITITAPKDLCDALEAFVAERGYANRSEACRDLIRLGLASGAGETVADAPALGTLTCVFDHESRQLAQRLTSHHHSGHDLTVCSTHVHLDHHACLEVTVLRGPASALRAHADGVLSQRGVLHGRLHLMPIEERVETHSHGGPAHSHAHVAVRDRF